MANDFLNQVLLDILFTGGEMPDASKLTGLYNHLKTGLIKAGRAIGDLYSEKTFYKTDGSSYTLGEFPIVGTSLSRILGGVGWLNQKDIGRNRGSVDVVIVGHITVGGSNPTVDGFDHYNKRQFVLPFPPTFFTSSNIIPSNIFNSGGTWSLSAPPAPYVDVSTTYTTFVSDLSSLDSDEKFHVSDDGVLTLYKPLDESTGFTLSYTIDSFAEGGLYSTFSVIPDFEETSRLCSISLVSTNVYDISLPKLYKTRNQKNVGKSKKRNGALNLQTWVSSDNSPTYGKNTTLPWILRNAFGFTSQAIPDGIVYLFDEDSDQIILGGSYTYIDKSKVRVSGLSLEEGSDRYRLITSGVHLNEIVGRLLSSYVEHTHSGEHDINLERYNNRVSHASLLNNIDEGGDIGVADVDAEGFCPSTIGPTRNPHPQYLHRYGYQYGSGEQDGGDDEGNRDNAMLGPIVLSQLDGNVGTTSNSYALYFGSDSGPYLHFHKVKDHLYIGGKDVEVGSNIFVSDEFRYVSDKTRYKFIHPAEGALYDLAPGNKFKYVSFDGVNGGFISADGADASADFPIHLPKGATVENIYLLINQAGATEPEAILYYHDYNFIGGSIISSAVPVIPLTSAPGGGPALKTLELVGPAPINYNYMHCLSFISKNAGDGFYGALIKYTQTSNIAEI